MTYYLFTTTAKFTKATAKRIDKQIKAIDKSASFVGPLKIPGCAITGWIERPIDGTNDHRGQEHQEMQRIAREAIGS